MQNCNGDDPQAHRPVELLCLRCFLILTSFLTQAVPVAPDAVVIAMQSLLLLKFSLRAGWSSFSRSEQSISLMPSSIGLCGIDGAADVVGEVTVEEVVL